MTHDHLTAETLAAWADDALSREERTAVEVHAADCAECQALLAAMIRTVPEETAPVAAGARWWRTLRWVAPITAAAAAVLVWSIVPARAPDKLPQPPDGTVFVAAPPPPAAGPDAQVNAPAQAPRQPEPTPQPEPKTLAKAEASKDLDRDLKVAASPAAVPPPPAPARESGAAAKQEAADAASANTAAPRAAARNFAMALAAPAPAIAIASPNPDVRWRIAGTAVERTTDGGASWLPQQTGSEVRPAAGSAPSATVCWLVGPGGTVLLTTDGQSWKRLAFPLTANLIAVTATDERHAKVTLADGRTFTTVDGGETWTQA